MAAKRKRSKSRARGSKARGRKLGAVSRKCKGLKKRAFHACLRAGGKRGKSRSRRRR